MLRAGISMPVLLVAMAWLSSCASYNVVPNELLSQVDDTVGCAQLHDAPDQYRGRIVIVGGEVLSAKRLKNETRIEVLQLPLDKYRAPDHDRTSSQGRFLAFEKEFVDPATLPPGHVSQLRERSPER